jgi:hypothetical protein
METMREFFVLLIAFAFAGQAAAQEKCGSVFYRNNEVSANPSLTQKYQDIEDFIRNKAVSRTEESSGEELIIKIPVIIHNLYHNPEEKITPAQVNSQIEALNKYFRRRNADTINAPVYFRQLGADIKIEFQLAVSDPKRKSTTGIIYKYTPILNWTADDKMKFSASQGDDAWDPASYLNIWVCNLDRFAGYASLPGGELQKDGVVIGRTVFGTSGTQSGYTMGKTAVHEIGHWLGLRHLWGDEYCGEDGVADTPKQATYTVGCPTGIRVTCGSNPYGDMYMNYMDYTNDVCINMFTQGQKARMRSLFAPGGIRNGILNSKGFSAPLIMESPGVDEDPRWLHAQLYPNPASNQINLDLQYDARWVGKTISVTNLQGQNVMNLAITSKNMKIDISRLQPGIYFLAAKKDDGESMMLRFVKL